MDLFLLVWGISVATAVAAAMAKDNLWAALILLSTGLAVASMTLAAGLEPLFFLITLMYVASALVLVVVTAAGMSEGAQSRRLSPLALAPAALLGLSLLGGGEGIHNPIVTSDVLMPAFLAIAFALLIALEILQRRP